MSVITRKLLKDKNKNLNICACGVKLPANFYKKNSVWRLTVPYIINEDTCETCNCKKRKALWEFNSKLDYSAENFLKYERKFFDDCGIDNSFFVNDKNVVKFYLTSTRIGISVDVFDKAAFEERYGDEHWFTVLLVYQVRKTPRNMYRILSEYDGLDKYIDKVYEYGGICEGWTCYMKLIIETKKGEFYKYTRNEQHPELDSHKLLMMLNEMGCYDSSKLEDGVTYVIR